MEVTAFGGGATAIPLVVAMPSKWRVPSSLAKFLTTGIPEAIRIPVGGPMSLRGDHRLCWPAGLLGPLSSGSPQIGSCLRRAGCGVGDEAGEGVHFTHHSRPGRLTARNPPTLAGCPPGK